MVNISATRLTIPVTLQIDVDPQFADLLLNYPDIFSRDYIGYWAYGAHRFPDLGWVIVLDEEFNEALEEILDDDEDRDQYVDNYIEIFAKTYRETLAGSKAEEGHSFETFLQAWRTTGIKKRFATEGFQTLAELTYVIDEPMVHRIISEGVKLYGHDFQEQYDAVTLDNAIQMALFGEVVYG